MNRRSARLLLPVLLAIGFALPAAAQDDLGTAISKAITAAVNSSVNSSVMWATNFAVNTAMNNVMESVSRSMEFWDDDVQGPECPDGSHTNFGDDLRTYSAVEQKTLPATIGSISVHGAHNGGVSVRGWARNEIQLTACKYAGAGNDAEGQQRLAAIQMQISGGDISATGPDEEDRQHWTVHILVQAPKSIAMRLEAYNGPMSIRETGSDVEAHTVNGPLSIKLASGTVRATTQNGPLTISDCSGNINATAQNGPLTVSLNDKEWRGQGLEASTRNGPLTVKVPEGYLTGVDILASGHGPFSCNLRDCENAQASKPWDNEKHVHLGSGNTLVKVSTVNGPVQIGSSME